MGYEKSVSFAGDHKKVIELAQSMFVQSGYRIITFLTPEFQLNMREDSPNPYQEIQFTVRRLSRLPSQPIASS